MVTRRLKFSIGRTDIFSMPNADPDPLHAFQAALEKRGYAADAVDRRLQMARRILAALDPADTSERGYRQAVDRVVDSLSDPASAARCKRWRAISSPASWRQAGTSW